MSGGNTQTKVPVTVSVDAAGTVSCSPELVVVMQQNSVIDFSLSTSGYAFLPRDTVVVSNPGDQFPYPSATMSDQRALLVDKCTVAGSYTYTVYVTETATGNVLSHDPGIRNGGTIPL